MDVYPSHRLDSSEPIVITGIGMIASVGDDRETVWKAGAQRCERYPQCWDGRWNAKLPQDCCPCR